MYCTVLFSAMILTFFAKRLYMAEKTKIIQPQAGFQEKFVSTNVDFSVGGGVLNPQPLDSLIATPNGFVRMGDIKAGDVICDTKGGTQVVNFVIDKGVQPCVEFTLSDGRKVQSALSHNWLIIDKHKREREVSAEHIINYMRTNADGKRLNKTNYKIPLPQPCVGDLNDNNIHPYLLGLLLGDGCFSDGLYRAVLTTTDSEIVERISELGYKIDKIPNRDEIHYFIRDKIVKTELKKLGLWGKRSYEKFIPKTYLFSSVENRIELLKGLMDSDGHCSTIGQCCYGTTSPRLRDDVALLVYSLGGRCSISIKHPKKRVWDDGRISKCREAYALYIKTVDDEHIFNLQRKKNLTIKESDRIEKTSISIVGYKIITPQEVRCINVSGDDHLYLTDNYVITRNCGKSFAAVLSVAEPAMDGRFRGLFLRNNLADARAAGGILDTFKEIYGESIEVVESGEPHVTFKSGARIDVTHVADQSRDKILQRFKGRQYDFIYFDEGTGFEWSCFTAIYSRNRGTAQWTGRVRMTTNPDKNHWLRRFLDWYIGPDGFIREDREGVVRYFFINGETVNDVIWGDSKESVYQQCKIQIDRVLAKVNGKTGNATYEDLIKSFTFYLGRMSENKASIGNNKGYVGSVALTGGRSAQQLLEGNWNVSPDIDLDAPIQPHVAAAVFDNDPCINNDKWITVDLADVGDDNTIILIWNGFHVIDYFILSKSVPVLNAQKILQYADLHNIADSHIIYDATRALYINDYIPEAVPYISGKSPRGRYSRMASRLKDECYLRLVEMIKKGRISFADKIANAVYIHNNMNIPITIQTEFIEECSVVRFDEGVSGKKQLLSKKQMNKHLGKNRSMDLLDACSMRMLPILDAEYGEELMYGVQEEYDTDESTCGRESIYDDTTWA